MERLTQRIRAELDRPGTPDELTARVSKALEGDFVRHEKGIRYAIRVAMDRERLVYWMGRLLSGEPVALEAAQVLGGMGYSKDAIAHLISLGEPRASLV